jgi:hypothetical protein
MTAPTDARQAAEACLSECEWHAWSGYNAGELLPAIERAILAERQRAAEEMRGLAVDACKEEERAFLSPQYATSQPLSSMMERFACGRCAEAIAAIPLPDETPDA